MPIDKPSNEVSIVQDKIRCVAQLGIMVGPTRKMF